MRDTLQGQPDLVLETGQHLDQAGIQMHDRCLADRIRNPEGRPGDALGDRAERVRVTGPIAAS